MTKERAEEILRTWAECDHEIKDSLRRAREECDDESYEEYRGRAARLMARMFSSIAAPIYECYPTLAPDWYKPERQVRAHGIPAELRSELLAHMESVLAKVTRLPDGGSDLPDDSGIRPLGERVEDVVASVRTVKDFLSLDGK